jgi:hypothetical protein
MTPHCPDPRGSYATTEPAAPHATTSTLPGPDRSPHCTPISRATGELRRAYRAGGGVAVHATAPPPRAAALGTNKITEDGRGQLRALGFNV